jgi:hypothetical protein
VRRDEEISKLIQAESVKEEEEKFELIKTNSERCDEFRPHQMPFKHSTSFLCTIVEE